jgi:hypothetical protein
LLGSNLEQSCTSLAVSKVPIGKALARFHQAFAGGFAGGAGGLANGGQL